MNKENIVQIIKNMQDERPEDKEILVNLINNISSLTDDRLQEELNKHGIQNEIDIRKFVDKKINERPDRKFISLNSIVGYGVNGETLHIHVIPEELKDALTKEGRKKLELDLIDALEKIQGLIGNEVKNKEVRQVYAVSGLLRGPILKIFENLEFDTRCVKIKDAKEDSELGKFYEHFKDNKYLGRANIMKEKLLSKEWDDIKNNRKQELKTELGIEDSLKEQDKTQNDFEKSLSAMVKTDEEIVKELINKEEEKKEISKISKENKTKDNNYIS